MRAWIRKGLRSSYVVYREYRLLRLALEAWRGRHLEPILVYQMGKVGSTTLVRALRRARGSAPRVYHLHTLQRSRLRREELPYREHFEERRLIAEDVRDGLFIRRQLFGWLPTPSSWKIVTLARDPVRRNISAFFQSLDFHLASTGFADRIRAGDGAIVDDLLHHFLASFPHEEALHWFDDELRTFFDVDLLRSPFPHEKGYRICHGPGVEVLLLRLEDLDRIGMEVVGEFLGMEHLDLRRRNLGREKYYAAVYRRFLERITLPGPLLDTIYSSRMARTLYTPREIAAFRARWSDHDGALPPPAGRPKPVG